VLTANTARDFVGDGVAFAVECIHESLFMPQKYYIDSGEPLRRFCKYHEFAQKTEIFVMLLIELMIPFGINFDPSNAFLAGEDPLSSCGVYHIAWLRCMPATDIWKKEHPGSAKRRVGITGCASRLKHGEIGTGLNDYDKIFTELRSTDLMDG
jgi:hypothetical protein